MKKILLFMCLFYNILQASQDYQTTLPYLFELAARFQENLKKQNIELTSDQAFAQLLKIMLYDNPNGPLAQNYFPFASNPQLGWDDFEQNFRKKYQHLDIPKIYNLTASENDQETGYNSTDAYILFNNPGRILTPQQAEYILLHETGHHTLRTNNPEFYKKQDELSHSIGKALFAITMLPFAILTYQNISLASTICSLKNFPHKTSTIASLILPNTLVCLCFWKFKNSLINEYSMFSNILYPIRKKEEFLADDFANTHADITTLKSMLDNLDHKKMTSYLKKASKDRFSKIMDTFIFLPAQSDYALHLLSKIIAPAHPTPLERKQAIQEEIHRRVFRTESDIFNF